MTISRRQLLALGATTLVVAACSDDSTSSDTTVGSTTTSAPRSTTTSTSTTIAATTTSAVEESTTTTAAVAAPVYPLTGEPLVDVVIAARPALVVKIDNHPDARPQTGLNRADIVYEENVENLTRFALVFQTQDSDPVGPIRSGRTQDVDLLGSLNKPLFGWSGGNGRVTTAIRASDLVEISPTVGGTKAGFFRLKSRKGPHNLYASTTGFRTFTPLYAPAPLQQFTYRAEGEAFNAEASGGVEVKMDNVKVNWNWDAATSTFLRSQNSKPHNDADLGRVNAKNVLVLEVAYRPSPADENSPEAQTVGTGLAYVFTAGVLVRGTWTRADRLDTWHLADENGTVIPLTPGRTWIELARENSTLPVPPV